LSLAQNKQEFFSMRGMALGIWCRFYKNTLDAEALKILYKLLIDRTDDYAFRIHVVVGMRVVGADFIMEENHWHNFSKIKDSLELEAKINWEEINDIIDVFAPHVRKEVIWKRSLIKSMDTFRDHLTPEALAARLKAAYGQIIYKGGKRTDPLIKMADPLDKLDPLDAQIKCQTRKLEEKRYVQEAEIEYMRVFSEDLHE
jgi:hypothetical protein